MYITAAEYIQMFPTAKITSDFYENKQRAENDINALTFNRISNFDKLTEFQKRLVKRATGLQIKFIGDNVEMLDSIVDSYSIGGVSVSFDKNKVLFINGTIVSKEVYSTLLQTGLCFRGVQ